MRKNSAKFISAALSAVTAVSMSGVLLFVPAANAQSTSDLQAQIAALLAQIQQLQSQLNTAQGGSSSSYSFTRDLTLGSTGADVKALQQFLNSHGAQVAASGAGSSGNESTYFGTLTKAALAKWQAANGVSPAAGYFGPITRAKITSVGGGTGTGGASALQSQIDALLSQLAALQARLAATSSIPTQQTSINPASIVGVDCHYLDRSNGLGLQFKGSGVIISPTGVILTVRHLVDLVYTSELEPNAVSAQTAANFSLDYCEVGQVPADSALPTASDIRSINPSILVPVLGYRAKLKYVPSNLLLSDLERKRLDFALLQIDGVSNDGPTFGFTKLPDSFPTATLLKYDSLDIGNEVITYGFPGDITDAKSGSFNQLYLAGSVGRVKEIYGGDSYFYNQPFVINTAMEVRSGRSGSPLFWNGKVAGIINAHAADNVTDSYSVSSEVIYKMIASIVPNL